MLILQGSCGQWPQTFIFIRAQLGVFYENTEKLHKLQPANRDTAQAGCIFPASHSQLLLWELVLRQREQWIPGSVGSKTWYRIEEFRVIHFLSMSKCMDLIPSQPWKLASHILLFHMVHSKLNTMIHCLITKISQNFLLASLMLVNIFTELP